MKTKKNNACPLIKEIEKHDDVSSEKKKYGTWNQCKC